MKAFLNEPGYRVNLMISAYAIASPWISDIAGVTEQIKLRHQIGLGVIEAITDRIRYTSLAESATYCKIVQPALDEFIRSKPDQARATWSPELTSLLTSVASRTFQPHEILLQLQIYLIRTTNCDLEGKLSNVGSSGFGSLFGLPIKNIKGMKIKRQNNNIFIQDQLKIESKNHEMVQFSCYDGSAEDLIAEVSRNESLSKVGIGTVGDEQMKSIERAHQLINTANIPIAWILSAISEFYVTEHNPTSSRTGSRDRQPGMSYFSATTDPYVIAEALLHESCHQNFYLGNLDSGLHEDDGILRMSIAVKKERPLWAILMAYHAFTNVAVFYKKLSNEGHENVSRYAKRNVEYSRALEKTLSTAELKLPRTQQLFEYLRICSTTITIINRSE